MPKRKNEEKIKHYQRKLRKLQRKEHRKKDYKRIIYTSSEESATSSDNEHTSDAGPGGLVSQAELEQEPIPADPAVPELDSTILTALGETTEEASKFGPKIHDKLSALWLPILRKGISKDMKEKLFQDYMIPENCPLLQAPKLNPEISAAVSEATRIRDKKVESVQQQLGIGITALNKGLELLLDDGKDRLQAVKFLSDSCRVLCDLHHLETEARKRFVTPGLDKTFLNAVQDIDRDEMLFGKEVPEKIKSARAIEKHGLQIKKPTPVPKVPFSPYQPSTSRSRPQGNWGGPSHSLNKGGRGGPRKSNPSSRKGPTGPVQTKPPSQYKPCARAQHH